MQWMVHGERPLYQSPWLSLVLTTVEPPGTEPFEHHVVRYPGPAAGVVVCVPQRGVLLMWRHRFTTDTWGWEIPAGRVEAGEDPIVAAARETEEETGWRPGPLDPLVVFNPANGSTDLKFIIFSTTSATHIGEPTDLTEASRIEWVPPADVRRLVLDGQVPDGLALCALTYAMVAGHIPS